MKKTMLGGMPVSVQVVADDGGHPGVILGIGEGPSALKLRLGPTEVVSLIDVLGAALTDPELAGRGHAGSHPVHDPVADPDSFSHRPAIGGLTHEDPLGRVSERDPDPSDP